jgi:hypothetical protein
MKTPHALRRLRCWCRGCRARHDSRPTFRPRPHAEALESRLVLSSIHADFNGDGFDDLAVGVPSEDVLIAGVDIPNGGAVQVLYGSGDGLTSDGDQLWTQNGLLTDGVYSQDLGDHPEANDRFGSVLAAGDFNGDGYADLAVGVPAESITVAGLDRAGAGAVHVLYGSGDGLTSEGNQVWTQNGRLTAAGFAAGSDIAGAVEAGDRFGASLAVGNFNGDNRDGRPIYDLAIGVPCEDLGAGGANRADAGAVQVLYGSAGGITNGTANNGLQNQLWTQNGRWTASGYAAGSDIQGGVEAGDHFGFSLAAGNFDANTRGGFAIDDLVIGVPYEDLGSGASRATDAGAVHVLYGSAGRLTAADNELWTQDSDGVRDRAEDWDLFGWGLAAGNFDDLRGDDLAIATLGEYTRVNTAGTFREEYGAVHVLYAGWGELSAAGDELFTQSSMGAGVTNEEDQFGFALAAADFDGDGDGDLAIGVPLDGRDRTGSVHVVFGQAGGLDPLDSQYWSQNGLSLPFEPDGPDIPGTPEPGDRFGTTLAVGDYDGDGRWDLSVGVPSEDLSRGGSTFPDAGAVNVIYGEGGGLTAAGSQQWHQDSAGVQGGVEAGDRFGGTAPAPCDSSPEEDWQIRVERLRVATAEDSSGDEPYFLVIGFRSRFAVAGSTSATWGGHLAELGDDMPDGREVNVPEAMGRVRFDDVRRGTSPSPVVVGALVVALESDSTSWGTIRDAAVELQDAVEDEVRRLIENAEFDPFDPAAAREDVEESIRNIRRRLELSFLETVWEVISAGTDHDDNIGAHVLFFVTDPPDGLRLPPDEAGLTVGELRQRRYEIGTNPIRFTGDEADYRVTVSVSRTR